MPNKLTDVAVRNLRARTARREVRDGGADGLYLVIQPRSGRKSWAMRFRRPDGTPAKLTLGPVDLSARKPKDDDELRTGMPLTLAEARVLASEMNRRRKGDRDVVAEHFADKQRRRYEAKHRRDNAFSAKAREFIEEHARRKTRRWRETARMLGLSFPLSGGEPTEITGGLAARWRGKSVGEIDGHDIHAVVREAQKHSIPGIKARTGAVSDARGRALFRALSKFFSYSGRRGPNNPCASEECPKAPVARDRELTENEIRWLWSATENIGQPFGPLVRLLLLTGARREEIARMTWNELSNDGATLVIPASRTKNRRPHLLDLPRAAQEILGNIKHIAGKPAYVFTTNGKTPVSGFSKIKTRLDHAILAAAKDERRKEVMVPPWRLHDLRRTAATGMAAIGVQPHVIEAVLNHVSGHRAGVAGIYNRFDYRNEKREALEHWATRVLAVVAGPKVVQLHGRVS
jgi:integrase